MKRWVASGAIVIAMGWWLAPTAPPPPQTSPEVPTARATRIRAARSPTPLPTMAPAPQAPVDRRSEKAARDCALPGAVECDEHTCVTVAKMPDLDAFSGWWTLSTTHPQFVAQTLARDIGWRRTPCARALDPIDVLTIETPSGDEYWCARPAGSVEAVSLCNRALRTHHPSLSNLYRGDERILSFQRHDVPDR